MLAPNPANLVVTLVKSLNAVPSSSKVSVKKRKLLATITATTYVKVAIVNVVESTHEVKNVITVAIKDVFRMIIQGKLIKLKLRSFNHFFEVSNAVVT